MPAKLSEDSPAVAAGTEQEVPMAVDVDTPAQTEKEDTKLQDVVTQQIKKQETIPAAMVSEESPIRQIVEPGNDDYDRDCGLGGDVVETSQSNTTTCSKADQ